MYPILYSFRRCPFAMRARLAIAYADICVEIREVVLKNKPVQLLDISAKATVPVLQLNDGIIDQSLDIMLWSLQQNDEKHWLKDQAQQLPLINVCDASFKGWLDKYKYADRHPEKNMEYYRAQCEGFLTKLELRLAQTPFLFGDSMSFADAAIFPFIRQFAHVDKAWFYQTKYIHLQKWLLNQIDSDLFQSIMFKYKPWVVEQDQLLFP